jgi:hypothetical protein
VNRALLVVTGLSLALGGIAMAGILLAVDSLSDDEPAALTPPATATTTPSADADFVTQFQPFGCDLMDFTTKLNAWTVMAQERGDRLEILGGIGFWREILAGIQQKVANLPGDELQSAAQEYVAALDGYLANLGEYWFTAQPPSGQAATDRLAFAEQQGELLQAEAEEAAGGPFNLRCPAAL